MVSRTAPGLPNSTWLTVSKLSVGCADVAGSVVGLAAGTVDAIASRIEV